MSKRKLEDAEYVAMLRRMILAAGRRFADSDPYGLSLFDSLRAHLDEQISMAASAQLKSFSCSEIALALGVSKQAVHKRFVSSPAVRSALSAKAGGA